MICHITCTPKKGPDPTAQPFISNPDRGSAQTVFDNRTHRAKIHLAGIALFQQPHDLAHVALRDSAGLSKG